MSSTPFDSLMGLAGIVFLAAIITAPSLGLGGFIAAGTLIYFGSILVGAGGSVKKRQSRRNRRG